jgi:murein DD-endopeptidase MepM/ murein hydrolase activator NlpD
MSAVPWIVGAGAVGMGAYLWREKQTEDRSDRRKTAATLLALVEQVKRDEQSLRLGRTGIKTAMPPPVTAPDASVDVTPPLKSLPGRWVWPVGSWNGRTPVVSSGFGMRGNVMHKGVDVMFRRVLSDAFAPGTPNGSKMFVMPDQLPALAAHDGVVWSALETPRGFAVVIHHKPLPIATFYTHLDRLFVKPTARGTSNERVRAGQPIGNIGYSPTDPQRLKHLHFEIWPGGPTNPGSAIDPSPLMARWEVIGPVDRPPLVASAAQNQSVITKIAA